MAEASSVRSVVATEGFYFYLSLWMCAIVAPGFVPGFFLPRPDPTVLQNPVVHLHALVYVGWLGLVAYQMRLPSQGRTADHRRVGQWLVYYALLLVAMGLWVTLSRFAERIEMGNPLGARIQMWPPFSDMLVFPVLFGLAPISWFLPVAGSRSQAQHACSSSVIRRIFWLWKSLSCRPYTSGF